MVIAGNQGSSIFSATYYYNTDNEQWTQGPSLKHARESHSCGMIRRNHRSQEKSVIVAGGFDFSCCMTSVEILDEGATEWRQGPDLPIGIQYSQMVEDSTGGVVLVGGYSHENLYLDTLFQLKHGEAEWIEIPQRLNLGRFGHTAFLVPDSITDCS